MTASPRSDTARGIGYEPSTFRVIIDRDICTNCGRCAKECGWEAIVFDGDPKSPTPINGFCRACQRCAAFCPVGAIAIERRAPHAAVDPSWNENSAARNVRQQSREGGILLTSMGSTRDVQNPFDHLLLDACQVTNPSIDPLREPMELRTYIGSRPSTIHVKRREGVERDPRGNIDAWELDTEKTGPLPALRLDTPIMIAPMSYGAVSLNAHKALAAAAQKCGTLMGAGEGGVHEDLYPYANSIITQVASGRFSINAEALHRCAAIEIKVGQGAKPGIGGHLPGEKIDDEISKTRMIPKGTDAISPAPHHDIYSIEDLRQLIEGLKESSGGKPVGVKIAAVNNVAAIASGIVHAGAQWVTIDGFTGSTGAAPAVIRDNIGLPLATAIAVVDERLRADGIRNRASIIATGSIRSSADVAKAIALGADAVAIGTASLIALGCRVCHGCHTGRCSWGITTQRPELTRRIKPEEGAIAVANLINAWTHELTDMLGALGVNALESLRGNRDRLRAVGLDQQTCEILGVRPAGR